MESLESYGLRRTCWEGPEFAFLVLKGSPEVFKPQLHKALIKTAGSEPRAECPEQDLGLGPSWAAPHCSHISHCWHTHRSLQFHTQWWHYSNKYLFISFDIFLLTLQGLPGAWYDTCNWAWIKQKTSFSCCHQLPSFSQKLFCLILQDLTHYLIVFPTVGDCWQHSIFLQPAPGLWQIIACSHKKCAVNTSPENHTAETSLFLAWMPTHE